LDNDAMLSLDTLIDAFLAATRHTYATERLRAGVSLAAGRKLLGHQNVQTTLRYAEADLDSVKRELVAARRRQRDG